MDANIITYLSALGYTLNTKAYGLIKECDDWYKAAEVKLHERCTVQGDRYKLVQMGFARRICADDANLCEVIEINAGGNSTAQFDAVNSLLAENAFNTQYRRQLELTAAEGTTAAYWRVENGQLYDDNTVRGGRVRLNYIDANGFIPLTVENDDVVEAGFVGEGLRGGKKLTTLVLCTRSPDLRYQYRTILFDDQYKVQEDTVAQLGEVKPFSVLRVAAVNPMTEMPGFGYPKLRDVIPVLAGLDQAFTVLLSDIDTADKLVLINELLCKFDQNGKAITPNEQMKRRFVMMGEKLPAADSMVKEINPEIRIDTLRDTIEALMSLLTMNFGFGTKKYVLSQAGDAPKTATQYIGERQDAMQELNKQRQESQKYIGELCRAGLWFMNTFGGTAWNVDVDVTIEFDDSYVDDKASRLLEMRNDIAAGIGGKHVISLYLKEKYNLTDEEAAAWAANEEKDEPPENEMT